MRAADGRAHRRNRSLSISNSFSLGAEENLKQQEDFKSTTRRIRRSNSFESKDYVVHHNRSYTQQQKETNIFFALIGDKPLSEDTESCDLVSSDDSLSAVNASDGMNNLAAQEHDKVLKESEVKSEELASTNRRKLQDASLPEERSFSE